MKKPLLILSGLFFLLGCVLIYQNITYNDKKLHVAICDVGQGDAIFIRTPQGADILIDGGPDDSVLSCLGKHLPFWDKTIEIMILTHPHADHFTGFFPVLKNYKIKAFVTEELSNKTVGFESLINKVKEQKIPTKLVFAGDRFILKDKVVLEIVGPTREFLQETSPGGTIGESSEFASLESLLIYGKFSALLTGDSQAVELKNAVESYNMKDIDVFQVPHHGSRFGLTTEILDILNPKIAAISVGKNNRYGHPTDFTLQLLEDRNIKTLRTDQMGDIEIISDGLSWKVR